MSRPPKLTLATQDGRKAGHKAGECVDWQCNTCGSDVLYPVWIGASRKNGLLTGGDMRWACFRCAATGVLTLVQIETRPPEL